MIAFPPAESFVIDHVSSFVIRCSFCEAMIRKDVPIDEKQSRGMTHETVKGSVAREARSEGWRSAVTNHGVTLNFCQDHVNTGREMGVLRA